MKSLRVGTLGIALLAFGITGARAGDLGDRGSIKDGPYAAPTFVWSGLYVGGAIGYGVGESEFTRRGVAALTEGGGFGAFGVDLKGAQGVVTIGRDFQLSPRWVLGLFADYAFGEVEGNTPGFNVTVDKQWAVGGRLGVLATPSTLLYASGGYTAAHFASTEDDAEGTIETRLKLNGYFVGLGVEQAFGRNLSLRLDYRFSDYGNDIFPTAPDTKMDNEIHSVRLGVNYHFGR